MLSNSLHQHAIYFLWRLEWNGSSENINVRIKYESKCKDSRSKRIPRVPAKFWLHFNAALEKQHHMLSHVSRDHSRQDRFVYPSLEGKPCDDYVCTKVNNYRNVPHLSFTSARAGKSKNLRVQESLNLHITPRTLILSNTERYLIYFWYWLYVIPLFYSEVICMCWFYWCASDTDCTFWLLSVFLLPLEYLRHRLKNVINGATLKRSPCISELHYH